MARCWGLIEEAAFALGELTLKEDEVLAIVTDGVTEELSPQDVEFADERTAGLLMHLRTVSAPGIGAELVSELADRSGRSGSSDDLPAVVRKAVPSDLSPAR